jgi:predicted nucleic-acid-binding protein
LLTEIVFEIEYVLRKVYRFSKTDLQEVLSGFIQNDYLEVTNRRLLMAVVKKYGELNLSLADLFLFYSAKAERAEVFSFDRDFARLKRHFPKAKPQ